MLIKDRNNTYEIFPQKANGEEYMQCPKCSSDRKKKSAKSFSWNHNKNVGICHHCDTSFISVEMPKYLGIEPKVYKKPEKINNTQLSDKAVKWFEGRGISQKTLNLMKISESEAYVPQEGKKCNTIQFNYFLGGVLTNIKYRDAKKNFVLEKDCQLIPYNIDCVSDFEDIIIVEGEMDALSIIECGILNVISVPNGASNNLTWLDSVIDLFENKRIIIAVDNDEKGHILKNELIRRFCPENCLLVNFENCKDANEYLLRFGKSILINAIKNAEHIKIEGTFEVLDFESDLINLYIEGLKPGLKIGYDNLDELITWDLGRFGVVTGIPGDGKSEAVDEICVRLNILHGWKTAFFSPENSPIQLHASKLIRKITGKKFNTESLSKYEFEYAGAHLHENYFWIMPDDNFTIDNILEKAKYLIKTKGIKVFVIDPFNRLEQDDDMNQSKILKLLIKLVNFCKRNNILLLLVAHPVKMKKENGKFEIPNLYSINGTSHFYNLVDYGMTIYRNEDVWEWHVQKVKFEHLGKKGLALFKRNINNGRAEVIYEELDIPEWRNYNYLKNE